MDLLGSERCMPKQAFAQVSKVSIRVSCRCDALVNLHHVYAFPGHLFVCQGTQHLPRRVAATDRHQETPSRRDSTLDLCSDEFRSLSRHCIGIRKYFNLHGSTPQSRMENGGSMIAILYPRSSILDLLAAHYRIRPASGWYNFLVHFIRPPGTGLVFVDRSAGL